MRTLFAALFLSISFAASAANAAYPLLPEEIFAPVGFDANDDSQVVLFGHFPSTCHQAGAAEVVFQGRNILIRNSAVRFEGPCIEATIPWMTTVSLGRLAPGEYRIYAESAQSRAILFTKLSVFPTVSPRTDDFLYAYVNGASMTIAGRVPTLTISGSYSLTCMEIDRVVVSEKAGVIVVQPIVILRKDVPCAHPFAPIPFTRNVRLEPKTTAPTLVHIRSMNGQALNQILE